MIMALITAGGIGRRMQAEIPKQFQVVCNRPVIVHTMMAFQNHPDINVICVACLTGWQDRLWEYARRYNITKLRHVVPAGATGPESIQCGLDELCRHYCDDDIVLIHDGVRPLVNNDIINDCINVATVRGNAIAAIPCNEVVMTTTDGQESAHSIPRETLRRTQTPHGFHLGEIAELYKLARSRGITNIVASCDLMAALGRPVYFSRGAEKNIKLTTPEDFQIFRAILGAEK